MPDGCTLDLPLVCVRGQQHVERGAEDEEAATPEAFQALGFELKTMRFQA